MNTALPVSTISFNTTGFLDERLAQMVANGTLEFWAYIPHEPEPKDDDGNGKKHNHLYTIPAKRVQTEFLRQSLQEIDGLDLNKRPLGCLPFLHTKHFGDWYLYALHDAKYLKYKGLERKFHYKPEDIVTSDRDALNWYVRQIDLAEVTPIQSMIDAIGMGLKFEEYFMMGKIPIQQLKPYRVAWDIATRQLFTGGEKVSRETQKDNGQSKVSDKSRQMGFDDLPW